MMACKGIPWWFVFEIILVNVACFIAGLIFGVFNPALPDLQYLTASTAQQASSIMSAYGASMLAGGLLMAPVFDLVNKFLLLGFLGVAQAVFVSVLGLFPSLGAVVGLTVATVIPNTAVFMGCQAIMLTIVSEYRGPLVQAINMAHVIGLSVSPVAMEPLLGDYRNESIFLLDPYNKTTDGVLDVEYGFLALSICSIAMSVWCFVWYGCDRARNSKHEEIEGDSEDSATVKTVLSSKEKTEAIVMIVCMFVFCLLCSMKFVLLVNYTYTFVTEYLFWTPGQAALLASGFEFGRVAANIILIPMTKLIHASRMLVFDTVLFFVASTILIFTLQLGPAALWFCLMLIAIPSSNVFAVTNLLSVETIPYGAGLLSGIAFSGFGFGQFIFPPMITYFLDTFGAESYPALLLVSTILSIPPLVIWFYVAYKDGKPNKLFGTGLDVEPGEKSLLVDGPSLSNSQ